MRKQTKGVLTPKYATKTMMVIYPLLGGLIRLDVTPNGGFSAGVIFGSFGEDDILFLCFSLLLSEFILFSLFLRANLFCFIWISGGGKEGGERKKNKMKRKEK